MPRQSTFKVTKLTKRESKDGIEFWLFFEDKIEITEEQYNKYYNSLDKFINIKNL